jgi:hypothetical protein
MSYVSNLH